MGCASREGWRCLRHTAFPQQVLGEFPEVAAAFLPNNLRLLFSEPNRGVSTKLAVPAKKRQEVCSQWLDDIITCSLPLRLAKVTPSLVLQPGNLLERPVMLSDAGPGRSPCPKMVGEDVVYASTQAVLLFSRAGLKN